MKRNKRWLALALPLVLQLGLGDVAYAADIVLVDQTIGVSTPRSVRVNNMNVVGKISNPHVKVLLDEFEPNLVGVSLETFPNGNNPHDPTCQAEHRPETLHTVNMNVVADLQVGASGALVILVEFTETYADGTSELQQPINHTQPIGPVPTTGQTEKIHICIDD